MRHRLEPLRGLWFALGVGTAWACLAMPTPWAWSACAAFAVLACVPRTRGARAALALGALLECVVLGCFWSPVAPVGDVDGAFRVGLGREIRPGRWEGRLMGSDRREWIGAKVRLNVDSGHLGEVLQGRGVLRGPSPPRNPGGFDEARWAASEGLVGTLDLPAPQRRSGAADPFEALRHDLGRWVRQALSSRLDAPSSALWTSTLLADGSRLPTDVAVAFRRTGLYHMLSVSGFHLVVLGGTAVALLSLLHLGPGAASLGALLVVWGYVAFLGFPAPALRAAIAFTLFVLARMAGRRVHAGNALCLGAAALVVLDPNTLFQTGVQLTLAATAALVWLAPGLEALAAPRGLPAWGRNLSRALWASVAATLATAPILAWSMGTVPWIGIPAGILASGFFSAGFLASLGVVALSPLPPAWSEGFAGAAELCARAVLEVALRVGEWEAGWIDVVRPTVAQMAGWGLGLVLLALCAGGRRLRSRALVLLALLAASLPWWNAWTATREDWATVHVLSVGQGDAILALSPEGVAWLVDAGPRSLGRVVRDAGADVVVPALRALRVERLDGLAISHPDLDHWGGAEAVCERFPPGLLLEPAGPGPDPSPGWDSVRARLVAGGVRRDSAGFGQFLSWGSRGALVCLAPGRTGAFPDRNAASLVLSLRWGASRMLLAGDAETWTEDRMAEARADRRADILKLGHHGSKSSSGSAFLQAAAPECAVVSAGPRNRYGHPHREALERVAAIGARVLDTRVGSWEIRLHPDGRQEILPSVRRWWNGPWERRVLSFAVPWTWIDL